jgi:ribosome maturation protein SDO1
MSQAKFTTIRLTLDGERFELLVNPDAALDFKLGRAPLDVGRIVAVDEVFTDASKGLRASSEKLVKFFHTNDFRQVAEAIIRRGELQVTAEQRRRLIEEKKRRILEIIARNYVDPNTGLPHPPLRVEQAMSEARVSIDPFRDAEEQAKVVVEALRGILPLKSERLKLLVKIPPQFAPQAMGVLRSYGEVLKEEWGADGTLTMVLTIPAGVRSAMLERLGSITKGTAQATAL